MDVKDETTLFAGGVSVGMWKSTDGGMSWENVLNFAENYRGTEIVATSTGMFYVTIEGIGPDNGVYRSDDGVVWEHISPPDWPDTTQRTAIGIAPSNENIIYFCSCLYEHKTQLRTIWLNLLWIQLPENIILNGNH